MAKIKKTNNLFKSEVPKGKMYRPQVPKDRIVIGDLKNVHIFNCSYNEDMKPVCPTCGSGYMRNVDYGYCTSPTELARGELWKIGICHMCNTAYKSYFNLP